jgi:hypothetical protein
MRFVFALLLYHISISLVGQSSAASQVKAILNDGPNGFRKYTGVQKIGIDSMPGTYGATMTIDGTIDNEIFKDSLGYIYSAVISDRVVRKKAIGIAKEWIRKLKESLGLFEQWKGNSRHGINTIGYVYSKDKSSVSVNVVSENHSKKAIVIIHISYYH